jgi:DNA-binding NarL/FixJ family response regulator
MNRGQSLKRAIVVTDDEDLVREEISSVLRKVGFEIVSTPNGTDALDLCRFNRPVDLAVIDTSVVKTNPPEVAECVQEISPRVLFLSDDETESVPTVSSGHVSEVLPKPFRRAQLLGRVLEIMDRPLVLTA